MSNLYIVAAIDSEGFYKAKWVVSLPAGEIAPATAAIQLIQKEAEVDDGPQIPKGTELSAIPFDIQIGEYVPIWVEGCKHTVQFG